MLIFTDEVFNSVVKRNNCKPNSLYLGGLIQLQAQKIRWWHSGLISHMDSQVRNMPFTNLKKVQRHHFDASGTSNEMFDELAERSLMSRLAGTKHTCHNYPLKLKKLHNLDLDLSP